MFQKAKSEMEKSTDTIVYVHGYAVKWTEAVANALSLQANAQQKG
jgi:phage-related minor tail protein